METKETAQITPGEWYSQKATRPTDGEYDCAILATIDGTEYVIGETYGRVAEQIRPNADANARMMTAAANSYKRHFTDPLAAAEEDRLGKSMELLARLSNLLIAYGLREIDMRSDPIVETMTEVSAVLAGRKS